MASEMVERVAKAISKRRTLSEIAWKDYEIVAKDAIAAMREPTESMYIAGQCAPNLIVNIYQAMIDKALEE